MVSVFQSVCGWNLFMNEFIREIIKAKTGNVGAEVWIDNVKEKLRLFVHDTAEQKQ